MSNIVSFADVGAPHCRTDDADRELFGRKLSSWMPPGSFDFHAHLYDLWMLATGGDMASLAGPAEVGYATYRTCQRVWMGERCPTAGLFFPFPVRGLNAPAANQFLWNELRDQPRSRGLMIVRPQDDPADIDAQVARDGWCGFKVYHVFADRPDTFHAETQEFLPEWAWEIAHARGLCITLHIVLDRALADPRNQTYIRDRCLRYPNARLVLAHAARGFCGAHTVEGIDSLRGLDNVWFDTSVVCEPHPFEAILRTFGPSRLLYGSDFPVSELRGRALSLGDGFWWLYEQNIDWTDWTLGRPTKIGIESLLALRQACCALALSDADVERIFRGNAEMLLGLTTTDTGPKRERGNGAPTPSLALGAIVGDTERIDGAGQRLYAEARKIIPGGTQLLSKRPEQFAPEQWPAYYAEARGCEVIDLDGRHYFDFTHNGVGSCLLGYAHPDVVAAVVRRATLGSMASLNCPEEVDLARELLKLHPWAENVRFARGGGEAMAIAARIIRAATGRDVVAFCGYHGWTDWYLAANLNADHALDGHLLPGLSPAGLARGLTGTALPFTYNRIDELHEIVRTHGARLAGIFMEPTRNIEPAPGFLAGVRELCDSCGARLVFDEVTTGFRFHLGGVHLKYGVAPDVAVFAKALGNGHPAAAVIGRATTMQAAQESFISSTYWTEGIGTVAALATLRVMQRSDVPAHVRRIGDRFRAGCTALAAQHNLPLKFGGYPALTSLSFDHPENAALITLLTVRMLRRSFLAGGGFYPTLAHEDRHVDAYLAAAESVFAELAESLRRGDTCERIGGQVKQSGFARLT